MQQVRAQDGVQRSVLESDEGRVSSAVGSISVLSVPRVEELVSCPEVIPVVIPTGFLDLSHYCYGGSVFECMGFIITTIGMCRLEGGSQVLKHTRYIEIVASQVPSNYSVILAC